MIHLKPLPPTVARHNDWQQQRDGSYRCGNVVLRNVGGSGLRSNWRIFVRRNGRLVMVWPAQRPWGYGHPGQAKIGAAHLSKPQCK